MRVMFDTNILVSAFVFQSRTIYAMIDFVIRNHELVLSSYVVDELRDVIAAKFPKREGDLDALLTTLSFTLVYSPQHVQPGLFKIRDMCDYPVLYTAIIESVDVFVTGDKDFDDVDVETPAIMTVAAFTERYMK